MLPAAIIAWRDMQLMHRGLTPASTDFFALPAKAHHRAELFYQDMMQSRPLGPSAIRRTLGWTEIRAVLRRSGKILDIHGLSYRAWTILGDHRSPP
ncbi:hypothetical protein C7U61_05345 [Rhizobium sp. JAB6]|nr:hypothetical protein C7U61_05345 [Rhizobium sp. JAB6]